MRHFLSSKFMISFYYLLQIILLASGFYLLTSKIPILPWARPLTTYVILHLLILSGVQGVLLFLYRIFCDHQTSYLKLRHIAFLHSLSLLFLCFLSIMSISNFIRACIFLSIADFYLICLTFYSLKSHLFISINQQL